MSSIQGGFERRSLQGPVAAVSGPAPTPPLPTTNIVADLDPVGGTVASMLDDPYSAVNWTQESAVAIVAVDTPEAFYEWHYDGSGYFAKNPPSDIDWTVDDVHTVYCTATPTAGNIASGAKGDIFGWAVGGSNEGCSAQFAAGGELKLNFGDGPLQTLTTSGLGLVAGTRYTIAMEFDKTGSMKVYLDGVLTDSTTFAAFGEIATSPTFYVGVKVLGGTNYSDFSMNRWLMTNAAHEADMSEFLVGSYPA